MLTRRSFFTALAALPVAAVAALKAKRKVASSSLFNPPASLAKSYGEGMLVGDVFTVSGVYAVNPQTFQPTPHLQQFVVTSNDASGVGFHPQLRR